METGRRARWVIVAGVLGAAVGFALAAVAYLWIEPRLEARTDWLRELQGLAFTMVPVATVAGAVIASSLVKRSNG